MCSLGSKNFRLLLLLSISTLETHAFNRLNSGTGNILLVVHQETNGWYRCKAGEGGQGVG